MTTQTLPQSMHAVRVHQYGDVDQLKYEVIPTPSTEQLAPRQILVKVNYASVNFIDVYYRTGLYKSDLPKTLGQDASGVVVAVGSAVSSDEIPIGSRVCFSGLGCYAEYAITSADTCAIIPDGVSDEVACALIVNGMTAHYLVKDTYAVKPGDSVLVHAAAGGTGQLISQACRILGAKTVIGTASDAEKLKIATEVGKCTDVINYSDPNVDVVKEVMRMTDGQGVKVVYDGVGKSTWQTSLDSLAVRGFMASFGNASGPVPPFSPLELSKKSLTLCRPKMMDYIRTKEEFRGRARDLFEWVQQGRLTVSIHKVFDLSQIADAHREIEGRKTLGKILLRCAK